MADKNDMGTDDFDSIMGGGMSSFKLDELTSKGVSGAGAIKPADYAIDFEDEDELADEELPDEEPAKSQSTNVNNENDDDDDLAAIMREGNTTEVKQDVDFDELFADGDTWGEDTRETKTPIVKDQPQQLINKVTRTPTPPPVRDPKAEAEMKSAIDDELLKILYPDFKRGGFLQLNLFGPPIGHFKSQKPKTIRPLHPTKLELEPEIDDRKAFKQSINKPIKSQERVAGQRIIYIDPKVLEPKNSKVTGEDDQTELFGNIRANDLALASIEWSYDQILNAGDDSDTHNKEEYPETRHKRAKLMDDDKWSMDDDMILEGQLSTKLQFNLNDPELLFNIEQRKTKISNDKITASIPQTEKALMRKFNISNDTAYDLLKENYQSKVRATIGNLSIDHTMPARRLQTPYYKVKLSKAQMRSFHRPSFIVRPGTKFSFSKIKTRKRKRDRGKEISEVFNRTNDLTLGDTGHLFLFEYSEEFPPVLSNFGMGSKLINYYRKKNEEDTSRPKLYLGETHVLGVQDRSPFWNFGFVEPGNIVPTFYNNLIRAPVIKHDVKNTDFLLIRSTGGNQSQKYFLRSISNLFVVGQTYPVVEIPGPHSRRVTTASKNRLKMIVYRVLNHSQRQRLLVKDISSHFPDQNDMQNRQRLKEFMEFQHNGEDRGYWKIKPPAPLPDEEAIRSMLTPEDITLLESTQVGQQHLEDAGYGKTVEDEDNNDGMSIEEELAPWNTSKNFIKATQGQAMLQLHGEGDPSGRGEAFSFLKISMKGGFKAVGESIDEKLDKSKFGGHSYNVALQQKAYDEEIARTWYAQMKSLSITDTSELKWEEMENEREERQSKDNNDDFGSSTPVPTSAIDDDSASVFSHLSTSAGQSQKVLKITRRIRDENNIIQRTTEIVRDPKVIRTYIKRRQTMEDAELEPETIAPTDDEVTNKRRLKMLEEKLQKLQRNKERRNARKATKDNKDPAVPLSGKGIGKGKSTTRRCATCGELGHIRTNKACPLYNERNGSGSVGTPANLENSEGSISISGINIHSYHPLS